MERSENSTVRSVNFAFLAKWDLTLVKKKPHSFTNFPMKIYILVLGFLLLKLLVSTLRECNSRLIIYE